MSPRGVDPDMEDQTPNEARLERILIRMVAQRNGNHESKWQNWILSIVGTLVTAMVGWNITQLTSLREDVATVRATQIDNTLLNQQRSDQVNQRLNGLENKVWRGEP